MTPAARAQAAIEILGLLAQTSQPVEQFLRDWFRARRFAGAGDRRAIAERVYAILRRRAALAHRMGSEAPRALVIAGLLAEGADPEALFAGGYGPAPLTDAEQAAIAATPPPPPLWVKGEFPEFLEPQLARAFGARLLEEMEGLAARAPVNLRVNSLKATRGQVQEALAADGFTVAPTPFAPLGLRAASGTALTRHPLFAAGAFEVQDEAAQIAAALAGALPGMRVLDLAAGAGGKALALAAAMQNRGEILACDLRAPALEELERRAGRAGATIIRTHLLGSPHERPEGAFDIAFVDAPCSGSGTWRRQPELKWRLSPDRLAALTAVQDGLLDRAAGLATRIVYATCSILPVENEDRVRAFLARNPAFRMLDAGAAWQGPRPPGLSADFRASPAGNGMDGFYAALLGRDGTAGFGLVT